MVLCIVIVNFRTSDLTIESIKSLDLNTNDFQVVVVDNNSEDNSIYKLQEAIERNAWQDRVKLILSNTNGGFSYGNNLAIRDVLCDSPPPDFFLLLNPDTYIREEAICSLLSFMERHPDVGIVGSRLEDPDGTPQMSAFKFHTWLTELDRGFGLRVLSRLLYPWRGGCLIPGVETKTDWVAGASMMIRSSVFKDIGLLDEAYFMYYEEMDFCLQAARTGWSCWYVPESRVVHYVGQSSGVTDNKIKAKRRPQYWFDSRRRYFLKNYGPISALLADIGFLLGFATWRLRNFVQRKQHNFPPFFLWDSLRNGVFIKGFKVKPAINYIKGM